LPTTFAERSSIARAVIVVARFAHTAGAVSTCQPTVGDRLDRERVQQATTGPGGYRPGRTKATWLPTLGTTSTG